MTQPKSPPKSADKLQKIKSGAFSRGMSLAKMSLNAGAKAAAHGVSMVFASKEERAEKFKELLKEQTRVVTEEFGKLKGIVMKAGQSLSLLGEYYLPPEANAVLKKLQQDSPPVEFAEIQKILTAELGEKLEDLEIDPESIGSASLGQVHRARRKSTGEVLAVKVQYPGVADAIDSDLAALRRILRVTKIMPDSKKFDRIFGEVREMLHQECDYAQEFEWTQKYREWLKDHPQIVVPEPVQEFSTKKILTTRYQNGVGIDSPEVKALSQERRNEIGRLFLEIFFKEFFEEGMVQSDPHFGNFKVQIDESGDRLVLLDFGAVRKFPEKFLRPYYLMASGAIERDGEQILKGARGMDFIRDDDDPELLKAFVDLCYLFVEPFEDRIYDWGDSDLPKRAGKRSTQVAVSFRLRPPPSEVVFLDRKIAGTFIVLNVLGVRINARNLLRTYLEIAQKRFA